MIGIIAALMSMGAIAFMERTRYRWFVLQPAVIWVAVEMIRDSVRIGRARELGLDFGVNTDDPGAFGCNMASEYRLLVERFGFGKGDLEDLYARSWAARFRPVVP
jgi:hypothetical protein